jgi:hypothetical protein
MWLYTTLLGQGETTGGTVFFIGAAISAVGGIGFLVLLMGAKRKSKQ